MATYEWKVTLIPDFKRYPRLKVQRTYVGTPTTLHISFILNQVREEFRNTYGTAVAAPDSFVLKIYEKDGVFARFDKDHQLQRSVAELEEPDRLRGLHFEATATYLERDDDDKEQKPIVPVDSSSEDIIILLDTSTIDVKINGKKRTDDTSLQGSSSISSDSALPVPEKVISVTQLEPVSSTSKDRQRSVSPYESEVEVECFDSLLSPAQCHVQQPNLDSRCSATKKASGKPASKVLPRASTTLCRKKNTTTTACTAVTKDAVSSTKKTLGRSRIEKPVPKVKNEKACGKKRESNETTTSVWLRRVLPFRLQYCPQVEDQVYYYPERHMAVRESILDCKIDGSEGVYEEDLQPWSSQQTLGITWNQQNGELVVVKAVEFRMIDTKKPSSDRLAVLQLERVKDGQAFIIHLQEVPCEDDYFIPRQFYDKAAKEYEESQSKKFLVGKRARVISWEDVDCTVPLWQNGTIIEQQDPRSMYQSLNFRSDDPDVRKKTEDETWYAPWEVYLMDQGDQEPASGTLLTDEDIRRYGYGFDSEDFGHLLVGARQMKDRLVPILNTMLDPKFAMAKNLQTMADLGDDYEEQVPFPVCLTLIKDRLQNGFYRQEEALIFDIQQLPSTAESCLKCDHIIMRAKIIRDVLLEAAADPENIKIADVVEKYRMAYDKGHSAIEATKESCATTRNPEVENESWLVCSTLAERSFSGDGPSRKIAKVGGCFG